uniref:Snaclec rhodocytin subunit alpha n=1 Tax=Calloselasma rhodostoma TaxID=8717 RepID=SLYA_CALRH
GLEDCDFGWSPYDQHCYQAFNEQKTWDEAEKFCRAQENGAHLASIESNGEADFVSWLISQKDELADEDYVWIGLRAQNKEQQCSSEWSDGSSVSYENLIDLHTKKCGALEKLTGFRKWVNYYCEQMHAFVCKLLPY